MLRINVHDIPSVTVTDCCDKYVQQTNEIASLCITPRACGKMILTFIFLYWHYFFIIYLYVYWHYLLIYLFVHFSFVFQMAISNNNTVYLNKLQYATSGSYRCEISTDGPDFHLVSQTKNLTVMGKLNTSC